MTADVFIRTLQYPSPQFNIRYPLYDACEAAWCLDSSSLVVRQVPESEPLERFHWDARCYAERTATSKYYIFSDDDILPLGANWIERALGVAGRNPDYAILSGNQVNHSARVKPQGYEVQPAHMAGSPQLIRKGMIDWTQLSGPGKDEDEIVGDYCAEHRLLQGVMVNLDVNHIGQGFSVMNPAYWGKY
jgi:hypothetical protein